MEEKARASQKDICNEPVMTFMKCTQLNLLWVNGLRKLPADRSLGTGQDAGVYHQLRLFSRSSLGIHSRPWLASGYYASFCPAADVPVFL